MIILNILLLLMSFSILFTDLACAGDGAYSVNGPGSIIGSTQTYQTNAHDSLIEIARQFDLGYNEIVEANPTLDPFLPGAGNKIKLSTAWIIPDDKSYKGLIINLSELRLYYFFTRRKSTFVRTYPIGIGRQGFNTPVGSFSIIEKIVNPDWHVPKSIRREEPHLPAIVPAGPDNPLGSRALRLSLGDVLIHGTNRPFGIGRKDSHGCIRMYPEDIAVLFKMVKKNTKVTIVRQPIKVGVRENGIYMEVHNDKSTELNYINESYRLLKKYDLLKNVVPEKLYDALDKKNGVPVLISR